MKYIYTYGELYHHGILGQRWGVRRYQNADGSLTAAGKIRARKNGQYDKDDIVIKKGSAVDHLSGDKKLKLRGSVNGAKLGYDAAIAGLSVMNPFMVQFMRNPIRNRNEKKLFVYDDKDQHDKDVYEGAFSKYVMDKAIYNNQRKGKDYLTALADSKVYKYKMSAINDLVSPSEQKRVEIFIDTYRKNEKLFSKHLDAIDVDIVNSNLAPAIKSKAGKIKDYSNVSDEDLRKYGYAIFNKANEYTDAKSQKMNSKYYKELQKQGYNMLVDDYNKGQYNLANQPMIVLDAKKNLRINESGELTKQQRDDALARLQKTLKKKTGSDRYLV